MHQGAECIREDTNLADAARRMRDLHVGALPICDQDGRLRGIVTDRDIVVRVVAEDRDTQNTTVREFAQGTPIYVEPQADIRDVLQLMEENAIRRLPVVGDNELVGMISEADLATHLSEHEVSEFAAAVYGAPPSS